MDYTKIGSFIAEKRKEQHLTQKELADRIGLTDRAISRWERGIGCPDISYLEELSHILNVSILEILHGEKMANKEDENKILGKILKANKKWKRVAIIFMNIIMIFLLLETLCNMFISNISKAYENGMKQREYTSIYVPIISSSMLPQLQMQDIIKLKKVQSIDEIQEADIITFYKGNMIVTHRVVEIVKDHNKIKFRTKGDSNYLEDAGLVELDDIIGKMDDKIPLKYNLYEKNIIFESIKYIILISFLTFDIIMVWKRY